MKKLYAGLIGLTAASALAFSANAADMYAPGGYKDYVPAAVWAGFYAGANVGYGWGTSGQLACDVNCNGNTGIRPIWWGFACGLARRRPTRLQFPRRRISSRFRR